MEGTLIFGSCLDPGDEMSFSDATVVTCNVLAQMAPHNAESGLES